MATSSYIPHTISWNPLVGIIMIICNVLAIAFGKYVMPNPSVGAPLPMPEMFGGMGWTGLLATTSLGHILGIGTILGLAN
ncbi:MAG: photosystem I reaction center subunit PsaK [Xenococcaceae cyanobacterium MO_188.B19]|nr:photosystem I reaction center subunit PsaK [Xenococcaceae cyanobacterium MO_188.B19]